MAAGTKVQLRLGERVVAEVAFQGTELRVGRMKENDLVINNLAVSRFHAVLRRVGEAFEIEDLGSENGSFIDGVAVRGTGPVPAGAAITIGKHTLLIRSGGEAQARPPLPGKSDAWDAAQTYYAPELAPRVVAEEEEEVVSVEAELVEDGIAVADAVEAEETSQTARPPPRRAPRSLDHPDPDGLFAFGEEELMGHAEPDPAAAAASVVTEAAELRDELPVAKRAARPGASVPPAPAEPGSQTALFDFGLTDDLGLSEPSLARGAAVNVAPAARTEKARVAGPARPEKAPARAAAQRARELHSGLIIERGGRVERVVPLNAVELVAGRAPGCEILLASAGVSRRHARFVREGERFRVIDLGSANGIRVNGERLEARTLEVGDVVGIDDYQLTFVVDREPVDGAVRATAEPVGDAQQTVFGAGPRVEMPERDLVLEPEDEDASPGWEKQLERSAEVVTTAPVRAAGDASFVVEVAIAPERLPAALRALLRELAQDELRLPAELRLRRQRQT